MYTIGLKQHIHIDYIYIYMNVEPVCVSSSVTRYLFKDDLRFMVVFDVLRSKLRELSL